MKKADADSCASASLNVKIPFTAATSGSISEVMKPQAKNSTVTAAKAAMAFDRPPGLAVAWLGRFIRNILFAGTISCGGSNGGSEAIQPVTRGAIARVSAGGREIGRESCRERVCQYV